MPRAARLHHHTGQIGGGNGPPPPRAGLLRPAEVPGCAAPSRKTTEQPDLNGWHRRSDPVPKAAGEPGCDPQLDDPPHPLAFIPAEPRNASEMPRKPSAGCRDHRPSSAHDSPRPRRCRARPALHANASRGGGFGMRCAVFYSAADDPRVPDAVRCLHHLLPRRPHGRGGVGRPFRAGAGRGRGDRRQPGEP